MAAVIESEDFQKFLQLVEESARATKEGVRFFIEPAPGTLNRAKTKRHHFVMGRRGS